MTSSPDENDRLLAGSLPEDPFDGTTASETRWRTCDQIRADAEADPREWLVPDLLPLGALVLLVGAPKLAGKSTFAWGLVAAAARGGEYLGFSLPATKAVLLAEDGDADLSTRIKYFGLAASDCLVCSRAAVREQPEFADLVAEAVAKALASGAKILVVDTFAFWARMEAKAENDAGAVTAALRPLQEAADAGLLVLVVHHPSKREGARGGLSARGSTAFAGLPEAILELRPTGGSKPRQRVLHAETRFSGVRDLVIELVESQDGPPTYRFVGEAESISNENIESRVLEFLEGAGADRQHTREDVQQAVSGSNGAVSNALKRLADQDRIAREGRGRRGDPFLHSGLGPHGSRSDGDEPVDLIESDSVPIRSDSVLEKGIEPESESVLPSPPYLKGGKGNRITAPSGLEHRSSFGGEEPSGRPDNAGGHA